MTKYLRALQELTGITAGKRYLLIGTDNGSVQFRDDDGDLRDWGFGSQDELFTIEYEPVAETIASKRTQLAVLTAEIAQLEAQLAEESRLKVGDYARVMDTASVDEFALDDVVRISNVDHTAYPLCGECPVSGLHEWFRPASLTKITPAEARASLIAKIDAHFGGQEAK